MKRPSFAELYTPKLVSVLREGYGLVALRADAISGLTVAIVALPLSMAIAIACGLGPEHGLFAAIVGGAIVSIFGGSRFQIGGPAGAFIVLIAVIVEDHGVDGLLLATLMAGALLMAIGFLRLGTYIKYIPFPVTVGFTAGIAVIIFASQIKELLGLEIVKEPAALLAKLEAIWSSLPTADLPTIATGGLAIAIILLLRRFRPTWPGFLIAVVATSAIAALGGFDIATIESRFGGIPHSLPAPALPSFSLALAREVLPDALAIALLGAIESLLSAVVADGMTGRRHRSNCELVAQGGANITAALFAAMPVTGTIARTATNIRAGARGPISGLLHAAYLLAFMAIAAPLVGYIPLAALGAVLAIVSWNMAEKGEFLALLRASPGDAVILLATFLLTVFEDLTLGIATGVTLGAFLFLHRMAETVEVEGGDALIAEDVADSHNGGRHAYDGAAAQDRRVLLFKISGAFFFGATATVIATLERLGQVPKILIFDFAAVPMIDSTAAKAMEGFAKKMARHGARMIVAGARPAVRQALFKAGLTRGLADYAADVAEARALAVIADTGRSDRAAAGPR